MWKTVIFDTKKTQKKIYGKYTCSDTFGVFVFVCIDCLLHKLNISSKEEKFGVYVLKSDLSVYPQQ